MQEKTFIMIKPDGVKRKLVGEIIGRIEKKGYRISRITMLTISERTAREHYAEHKDKPFFNELINFITSGPVVAMVVEGEGVIEGMDKMVGATDPADALPGTLRFDYAVSKTFNIIHRSDSAQSAEREINLFFS